MKKFLLYFVLEFAVIFIVAMAGYKIMHVPYNWVQITITSVVSGAIIAYALKWSFKNSSCKK